jgi:hypothetical protein
LRISCFHFNARQAALLPPPAFAVHDDGDVFRQARGIEAGFGQALLYVRTEAGRC